MKTEDASEQKQTNTLGNFLRETRVASGASVEQVAKDQLLRSEYIDAIENDRWDLLPGDAYARGFLSSLARQYKLNPKEILQRYTDETGQKRTDFDLQLPFDDGLPHSGRHSRSAFLLVLITIAIALALYSNFENRTASNQTTLPEIAENFSAPAEESLEETTETESPFEPMFSSDSALSSIVELSSSIEAAVEAHSSTSSAATAATISSSNNQPSNLKASKTPSRLKISCAKDSAWIEIRFGKDSTWAVWVRENGPVYTKISSDTLSIRTGNFERLLFELNAQPLRPASHSFAIYNGQLVR